MVEGVWALTLNGPGAEPSLLHVPSVLSFCFSKSQFLHLSSGANKANLLGCYADVVGEARSPALARGR